VYKFSTAQLLTRASNIGEMFSLDRLGLRSGARLYSIALVLKLVVVNYVNVEITHYVNVISSVCEDMLITKTILKKVCT
jgi:hypothetical protein